MLLYMAAAYLINVRVARAVVIVAVQDWRIAKSARQCLGEGGSGDSIVAGLNTGALQSTLHRHRTLL